MQNYKKYMVHQYGYKKRDINVLPWLWTRLKCWSTNTVSPWMLSKVSQTTSAWSKKPYFKGEQDYECEISNKEQRSKYLNNKILFRSPYTWSVTNKYRVSPCLHRVEKWLFRKNTANWPSYFNGQSNHGYHQKLL